MDEPVITTTSLTQYPLVSRGKVRDIYALSPTTLLFIATDRISAYDVILANGIPGKGRLLTQLSTFWFSLLATKLPALKTHLVSTALPASLPPAQAAALRGRALQVRRLRVLPLESIVRGYVAGSAWAEYARAGTVHGAALRPGLRECERLDAPLWTPSTKAGAGAHDENISAERAAEIVGGRDAARVREASLAVYAVACEYAAERGVIIADTKFEFGVDEETDEVVLIDEVLTPDSSRFWDAAKYEAGRSQESLDKQFLRDWLTKEGLKGKEGVSMTDEVVKRTREGYIEAYERLTGQKWV